MGFELLRALALSASPVRVAVLGGESAELDDHSSLAELDGCPSFARASQDSVVLDERPEHLPPDAWASLIARCHEALRPDGVLVLRLSPRGAVNGGSPVVAGPSLDHGSLRELLAHHFGAVDMFAWDGFRRRPPAQEVLAEIGGNAGLFAVCRLFLPYAARPLELLRPRVVADGPDWVSTWLCERPGLPEHFLLRATLDAIGRCEGLDVRLRFMTSTRARFKIEARLEDLSSGFAELFVASALATGHGSPSWSDVQRIALDVRTDAGQPVDVRLSDARIVCLDPVSRDAPRARTSTQLRDGYDASYYRSMSGYGLGQGLHEHVNLHRAFALLPTSTPARVLDVGAARGELARHMIQQGTEVTLLDYSATAMGIAERLIGPRPGVRFVVDDAANLGAHVPAESQDAIFMTDFVEHVTIEELRQILRECRRVLAAGGVLVIHTPERYSGAIVTAKAIHGLHLNLFEIDGLEELLGEIFGAVEVFTWDGFERFRERGHCIELFALAWPQATRGGVRPLQPTAFAGVHQQAARAWRSAWAIERPRLPSRFMLDATVELGSPAAEGDLEIVFQDAAGATLARATRALSRLRTLPAQLRLSSELLMPASSAVWEEVERIVVSVAAPGEAPIELVLRDVCLRI